MDKYIESLGIVCRVLLAVFLFVLIQLVFIFGFDFLGINTDIYQGLFSTLYGIAVLAVFGFYCYKRSKKKEDFLMMQKPGYMTVFSAVVIAFGLLGFVTLYMYIFTVISMSNAPLQEDMAQYAESVDRFITTDAATVPYWDSILDFISATIIITLAEELVFRGVIFGELINRFHPIIAAVMSSLLFGILHGISVHIGYAFFCGVILCLVYYYSGSIWVSFLVHAIFNFMGSSLFSLFDSGIFGDLYEISDMIKYYTALFEVICILPGIAGYLLIYVIYKEDKKKKAEPKVEEVAV